MRPPWKLALIGGEVTLLAAFTGVGIHLAMQPHRVAFRPPPLTLPIGRPAVLPTVVTPLLPAHPTPAAAPSSPALGPELF
ncbi:MAG TPA: hypothetical protein VJO72_15195, partial [Candidatus Dormibacteraeota bacterium]|nr:hypothetical protein [Candidatus Dormibacteraeota bacterium]